ncbi:hypothetical protein JCM11641_006932 [Rhodosporidiobolus odoratus]
MVRSSDIILALVAIIFPPASVAFLTGCSCDLFINIALTLLGYIPGHIHAFYLIWRNAQAEERYGQGNIAYKGNAEWAPIDDSYRGQAPPPQYGAAGTTYGTA